MSEPLKGVVVSHASVAKALADAVREITGEGNALVAVSNAGVSPDELGRRVAEAVGGGPAVVFVDMAGSSCLHAAMNGLRCRDDVVVVAGVNLPMLLDFVYHRDLAPALAAERAATKGTQAIRAIPCR